VIVGRFQLTTILKINTFQKHINYLKKEHRSFFTLYEHIIYFIHT